MFVLWRDKPSRTQVVSAAALPGAACAITLGAAVAVVAICVFIAIALRCRRTTRQHSVSG